MATLGGGGRGEGARIEGRRWRRGDGRRQIEEGGVGGGRREEGGWGHTARKGIWNKGMLKKNVWRIRDQECLGTIKFRK